MCTASRVIPIDPTILGVFVLIRREPLGKVFRRCHPLLLVKAKTLYHKASKLHTSSRDSMFSLRLVNVLAFKPFGLSPAPLVAFGSQLGEGKGAVCLGAQASALRSCAACAPSLCLKFSPPAQRRRFEFVDCAAARPPRWGSPKEEQTAQPSPGGIAPCSTHTRPPRGSYLAVLASRYAGLAWVCARC